MTAPEQVQVTQADRDVEREIAHNWPYVHSLPSLQGRIVARHRHTATADALEALGRIASNGFGHPVRGLSHTRDAEMLAMMECARAAIAKIEGDTK
jgi:hypothetical protein